jgi:hypothetical protein
MAGFFEDCGGMVDLGTTGLRMRRDR